MKVISFPVLLLLMQLVYTVLGGTNQTQTANSASNNVTTTTATTSNSNAATNVTNAAAAADAGNTTVIKMVQGKSTKLTAVTKQPPQLEIKEKPMKVNNDTMKEQTLVLGRSVTNTDTTTVQQTQTGKKTATIKPAINTNATEANQTGKILADGVTFSDINNNNNKSSNATATHKSSSSTSTTSTSTTTTTTSTTTKTTTTTTSRPKKPTVTTSMAKQVEGEKLDAAAAGAGNVAPHVLPLQEVSSLTHRNDNEYIVPIVSVMLAVPLAIALFIVIYRRFRELWSTRHYRRMDFLVDGMYND